MRTLITPILISATIATAAAQAPQSPKGAELLQPFKQNLQKALLEGLAQSPEQAVEVCQLLAPEIAENLSKDGIYMGRTSDRLRNPDNAGPEWATAVFETYLEDDSTPQPTSLTLENGKSGYVEPILVQPLCLTCHGTNVTESLSTKINAAYPEDRATGYAVGDLRGVFWVEYPE